MFVIEIHTPLFGLITDTPQGVSCMCIYVNLTTSIKCLIFVDYQTKHYLQTINAFMHSEAQSGLLFNLPEG